MAVLRKTLNICALLSMGVALVSAHGGAHQKPLEVDPDADWATRHMAGKFSLLLAPYFPALLEVLIVAVG